MPIVFAKSFDEPVEKYSDGQARRPKGPAGGQFAPKSGGGGAAGGNEPGVGFGNRKLPPPPPSSFKTQQAWAEAHDSSTPAEPHGLKNTGRKGPPEGRSKTQGGKGFGLLGNHPDGAVWRKHFEELAAKDKSSLGEDIHYRHQSGDINTSERNQLLQHYGLKIPKTSRKRKPRGPMGGYD
jgi:hypothetical protein